LPKKYNFDEVINRTGTNSLKWDYSEMIAGVPDLLPFWVADMDFRPPAEVLQAMQKVLDHGVMGYTLRSDLLLDATVAWLKKRLRWDVDKNWFIPTPGIVPAIYLALEAFSYPGDDIILQHPVYYPFDLAVQNTGRKVVSNQLQLVDGRYRFDFKDLKKKISRRTKMLILCSPHNPVGRVWEPDELIQLAEICLKKKIIIIADEIHADLIMPGNTHIPIASISPEIADITVTCTAPNKTFNMAGLQMGGVIISNDELRSFYENAVSKTGIMMSNIFGVAAAGAAYQHGEEWLEQLLKYIWSNYQYLVKTFEERLPAVKVLPMEGTYLAWFDITGLKLSDDRIKEILLNEAKVWLDDGPMFGPGGAGYQRINLATSRSVLALGLEQMIAALAR
jgi:cystathionine beta-lyase